MRFPIAAAAAFLLLAGCAGQEDPDERPTVSTSASASQEEGLDYAAVCDGFAVAVSLPNDDAVEYLLDYNEPTGWATNASICDIEPDGEYYDVAAAVGVFGRAELDIGTMTEEQSQQAGYQEYTPENAAELLTVDRAEPGNIDRDEPCAEESCDESMFSYTYSFRFETMMGNVGVIAQFDYITTDASGDQQAEYREQAIATFTASMDTIATDLQ